MIDCGLKKTDLTVLAGISTNVMAKLGKNETVSMESLLKICKVFSCDIGDVMEIKEDEQARNENSHLRITAESFEIRGSK